MRGPLPPALLIHIVRSGKVPLLQVLFFSGPCFAHAPPQGAAGPKTRGPEEQPGRGPELAMPQCVACAHQPEAVRSCASGAEDKVFNRHRYWSGTTACIWLQAASAGFGVWQATDAGGQVVAPIPACAGLGQARSASQARRVAQTTCASPPERHATVHGLTSPVSSAHSPRVTNRGPSLQLDKLQP